MIDSDTVYDHEKDTTFRAEHEPSRLRDDVLTALRAERIKVGREQFDIADVMDVLDRLQMFR